MAVKTMDSIDKIKEALITQKKLSRLTGINEVRLSRGLNRDFEFTRQELTKIALILRIKL